MIVPFQPFTNVSAMLTQAWIAALWQGLVLFTTVTVCLRMFPGLSAARRSAVWAGVLVLLAGLHFSPVFERPTLVNLLGRAGQHASFRLDPRWSLGLAAVWLLTSAILAGMLVRDLLRVRGIHRRSTTIAFGPAKNLRSSAEVTRPCVVGYVHPQILLPEGLYEQVTASELHQVLLHEQEHIRRGDLWLNLLQKMLLVIFPLNPAVALVERRLCTERELACDDQVMRATGARKAYALCLARIAEHRLAGRGAALVLGAWDRRPELVRRVERILRGTPVELTGWRARAAAGLVMAGSIAGTVMLVQTPELVHFASAPAMLTASASYEPALIPPVSFRAETQFAKVQMIKATLPVAIAPPRPAHARRVHTHRVRAKAPATLMARLPSRQDTLAGPVEVSWSANPHGGSDRVVLMPALLYVVPTAQGWVIFQL